MLLVCTGVYPGHGSSALSSKGGAGVGERASAHEWALASEQASAQEWAPVFLAIVHANNSAAVVDGIHAFFKSNAFRSAVEFIRAA